VHRNVHLRQWFEFGGKVSSQTQTQYLNDSAARGLKRSLNEYFQTKVDIPRIRMGKNQEIETLIKEEALLFAMFLRNERQDWKPRIAKLSD
jgi:hypothetical protein